MRNDTPFLAAQADAATWQEAIGKILPSLNGVGPDHRLGIVYLTHHFAEHSAEIEILLRQSTGVPHWIGTTGFGVIGRTPTGEFGEVYGESGISVMICPFPEPGFRIFSGVRGETDRIGRSHSDWLARNTPPVVLCHADPGNGLVAGLIQDITEETDGYVIGGLSAAEGPGSQIADGLDGQGLSGALLSIDHIPLQTALSQGCSPIGPIHTVTSGDEQVILELDDRPALDVFKEDIGDILARNLERCSGYIFAALPVAGSDKGDYTVRNLIAVDPQHGALAVAAHFNPGDKVMFCRRDPTTAVADMRRMLENLKSRIGNKPVRGGLYVSCAARGPNQFDEPTRETQLIEEVFGTFPLTGFFANGEISRDRIYAYTGVLTLFL